MRNHPAMQSLRFESQQIDQSLAGVTVTTVLRSEHGFTAPHIVDWKNGNPGFLVSCATCSRGPKSMTHGT